MSIWLLTGFGLIGCALTCWIAGEVRNSRPARIAGVLVLIIVSLGPVIPAGLGALFAASNTSLAIGRAVQDWSVALRDALDAGRCEMVRDELRGMAERLTPTYETGAFIGMLDESAARLRR